MGADRDSPFSSYQIYSCLPILSTDNGEIALCRQETVAWGQSKGLSSLVSYTLVRLFGKELKIRV